MNQEYYRSAGNDVCNDRWSALDPTRNHPMCNEETVEQEAVQTKSEFQLSEELIFIKDSCDITVSTIDTKAAVSLQAALQAAIVVLINISIADAGRAEKVAQELLQSSQVKQISRQKTIIENSRNITVETLDTQVAVNIQILVQLLVALLVRIDIL
ncbi:spore coat protein X [Peribacillus deserti]|uniref:Spore coat protein X n=1 Tax=Peribacillus deserti TaxID=673318 RepID=A0ABS2QEQ1_9BACI|nr:spore coat protein [Peribacillus deserti]MBM7691515.1 spore coat protein X [Peribacillus deserti]